MHNNPKKSKALIITFIAVLLLLIIGYFIVKNRNSSSTPGTADSTGTGKGFFSLFGTSKPKDLTVTNGGTTATTGTDTPGTEVGPDTGTTTGDTGTAGTIGSTGQITGQNGQNGGSFGSTGTFGGTAGAGSSVPQLNPIPSPAGTPSGTTTGTGGGATTPTGGSGGGTGPTSTPLPPPICANDDPLVFTDSEKAQLDGLLKQYYLIAPGLKTADDVSLLQSDITTNQALVDQAASLTAQCQAQKSSPSYTGPQIVKDNPYYDDPNNANTTPYLPDFSTFEDLFKIW